MGADPLVLELGQGSEDALDQVLDLASDCVWDAWMVYVLAFSLALTLASPSASDTQVFLQAFCRNIHLLQHHLRVSFLVLHQNLTLPCFRHPGQLDFDHYLPSCQGWLRCFRYYVLRQYCP